MDEPLTRPGIGLEPEVPTMPSLLKAQGYHTALVGKTHLHPHDTDLRLREPLLSFARPAAAGQPRWERWDGELFADFQQVDLQHGRAPGRKVDPWDGPIPDPRHAGECRQEAPANARVVRAGRAGLGLSRR